MENNTATAQQNEVAFASDLNLKPGVWPLLLPFDGRFWQRAGAETSPEGELLSVTYLEQNRYGSRTCKKLTVFND